LKAINIINSISYILNEDHFAKYNLQQIVDEVGEEGLIEYVEAISTKIIRNLDTKTNFKNAKPTLDPRGYVVFYTSKTGTLKETIYITYSNRSGYLFLEYVSSLNLIEKQAIDSSTVNIAKELKNKIYIIYNAEDAVEGRRKVLSLPTNKTKSSEYPTYSFEQLVIGVNFKLLSYYIMECLKNMMDIYTPVPSSGIDLRDANFTIEKGRGTITFVCPRRNPIKKGCLVYEYLHFRYGFNKHLGEITEANIRYGFNFNLGDALPNIGRGIHLGYASSNIDVKSPNLEMSLKQALSVILRDERPVENKKLFAKVVTLI
jgi:hypothetical protein